MGTIGEILAATAGQPVRVRRPVWAFRGYVYNGRQWSLVDDWEGEAVDPAEMDLDADDWEVVPVDHRDYMMALMQYWAARVSVAIATGRPYPTLRDNLTGGLYLIEQYRYLVPDEAIRIGLIQDDIYWALGQEGETEILLPVSWYQSILGHILYFQETL